MAVTAVLRYPYRDDIVFKRVFCLDHIEYVFDVKAYYPPQSLTSEEKITLGLKVVERFGITMMSYFHIAYELSPEEGSQFFQSFLLKRLDEIPSKTLGGTSSSLPGIGGAYTYACLFRGPRDLRRSITKEAGICSDCFHPHGELCHRNGKTYFVTVLTYSDHDKRRYFNCLKYAILRYEEPIRDRFNVLVIHCKTEDPAFFVKILNNFFRNVFEPQDGDLAVYEDADAEIVHAGIYRETLAGCVVESKWGRDCVNIYRHELFFTPDDYGDIVKFYRLRQKV